MSTGIQIGAPCDKVHNTCSTYIITRLYTQYGHCLTKPFNWSIVFVLVNMYESVINL